jgi:fibronectin-binding autotransporter adhesin
MFRRFAIISGVLRSSNSLPLALVVFLLLAGSLSMLRAAITPSGNVEPFDPADWPSSPYAYIGHGSNGTLTVDEGSLLSSNTAYIGYNSGVTGTATVDGFGSNWSGYDLYVGHLGRGTATISNGGSAGFSHYCLIGSNGGATSVMNVTGLGSTLYAYHLSVGANASGAAAGALYVTQGGTVYTSDYGGVDGLWVGYGTGAVMVDGLGSALINRGGGFSITSSTSATLKITNGALVSTQGNGAFIGGDPWGYPVNPKGSILVNGNGSALNIIDEPFHVGYYGSGALLIDRGAYLSATSEVYVATSSGSKGVVQVDGPSSAWTNNSGLYVGSGGTATFSITGGAAASAAYVSTNSSSILAIDVGTGSSLAVNGGWGTLDNSGKIRVLAGAGVATASSWTPINAGDWSGSGTIQAVGGTWTTDGHQFTVSSVQSGAAGAPIAIDLSQKQRVFVTDSSSGRVLGGSFLSKSTASTLTFTAATVGDASLASLRTQLGTGNTVLGGWSLSASGAYATGDPAYLSYGVGSGHSLDDLVVWKYSGSSWSQFAATDLTCDNTYASFTVSSMGTYAVTGLAVPEPASLVLLLSIGIGSLLWWRRRR